VTPPPHPIDPTAIYVLDYGHHSSVIFPAGKNAFVEYSFGDWDYYALNHNSPCDALHALFASSSGAFGRRSTVVAEGRTTPDIFDARSFTVYVSRADEQRVVRGLEARWQSHAATVVRDIPDNVDFVQDPQPYSWDNDCNEIVTSWLRDMGCQVRGLTFLSCFQLDAGETSESPNAGIRK
jgi:hypothetical protein